MPRRKRIPPLPESFGGSEHDRFKRFAKAILSAPKPEVTPPEEVLAKLESEKQKIDTEIAEVGRKLNPQKRSRTSQS